MEEVPHTPKRKRLTRDQRRDILLLRSLAERGITPCFRPAFSPVLNPIETVWNKMKDYIAHNFSDNLSYDALRAAVKEAWEAIGQDTLRELVASMPERCQAVIDANGLYTPY